MNEACCQLEAEEFEAAVERNFVRNYLANSIEGGIYIGGMAFLSADTVMPQMIHSLGGADWIVSLMPVILKLGFVLPPLFTAHFVERLHRMMPFVAVASFFQRLPYLIAALSLFFLADKHPVLVLAIVALTPFMSGFFGGISLGAWMELVARIIPARRRASSWAIRYTITAVIGIGAGCIIKQVLDRYPGAHGYAILHLVATVFVYISYAIFLMIREPGRQPEPDSHARGLRDNLRSLPGLLQGDAHFRNYTLCRAFGMSVFIVLPFLPLYAREVTHSGESFIGILVMAQMAGAILGNGMAAYLGDRFGGRLLLVASRVVFCIALIAAFVNTSVPGFLCIYALHGMAMNFDQVGASTLCVEIFPQGRRPTYFSLLMFISFPCMLLASGAATAVRRWGDAVFGFGNFLPAVGFALVGIVVSTIFLLRVPEPRNT